MKLVSPKTFLAALLGFAFIAIKVINFDDLLDLYWIVFIGCLSVKALTTAFSQKAYDKDQEEAYQGKVLYRDLFGRFAYFAADIPLCLLFFACLLAVFCPPTALRSIILTGLSLIALGYAIWFFWYVSRNKRLRMRNGEWGTGVLSPEDERAWKQSSRRHIIILGIIAALSMVYLIFGDPRIYLNTAKLKETLSTLDSEQVTLEEIVPFEWTAVYTFDPYTSIDLIQMAARSKSPALKESTSEGMTHVVFTNKGQVVASVCAMPASLGYDLDFTGGEDTYYHFRGGGYSHIEYGDQVVFEVTQDNGFVRLYAYIEEK